MAPPLRVLTRLFQDADWYLHLSSLSRDIDLCFSFDRISYKCWLPIYYEDCLALPKRFPEMHQSFLNGDFVMRHFQGRQCCSNGSGSGKNLQQIRKIICWYYWLYPKKGGCLQVGFNKTWESYQNFKWMRMTSIACTMNFQTGLPKQINITSQPSWRIWEPFQSWATEGYNEYCPCCSFRKGQRRLPNELQFFRKGCKWILWVMFAIEEHTVVGNHP